MVIGLFHELFNNLRPKSDFNEICEFTVNFMKLAYMKFRPVISKVFQAKDQK